MSDRNIAAAFLIACVGVTALVSARRRPPRLSVTVAIALAVRIVVAVLAEGHTQADVVGHFQEAARTVAHGRDPLVTMTPYTWNFLPVMPYVWSVLIHLHLPWEITDKIPAILADCVNCVLVATLAPSHKRRRALQYALCPIALLTVSWHGQIEPVALTFALLALVALRSRRDLLAASLIGLAIAIKTWPAVFVVALLRGEPIRRWPALVGTMIAVPSTIFFTMPLFMHADLAHDASVITGYRSFVGDWGWTGLVNLVDHGNLIGYAGGGQLIEQRIGTALLVLALPVILWVWRRATPEVVMIAIFLTFFATTAGFGVTYLMWPVPLAIAFATNRTWRWLWPASVYAAVANLYAPSATVLTVLSIPVIVSIVLALPLDQRVATPEQVATARR